jgi:hypothetical protein
VLRPGLHQSFFFQDSPLDQTHTTVVSIPQRPQQVQQAQNFSVVFSLVPYMNETAITIEVLVAGNKLKARSRSVRLGLRLVPNFDVFVSVPDTALALT